MIIKRVTDTDEITGIKTLQNENLKVNLSEAEINEQGFVTAEYSIPLLHKMHALEPAVIAKEGDTVVGYALVVTKELYGQHDLLDLFFSQTDNSIYNGELLRDINYTISGQLCVAKSHRGKGVAQQLYHFYKQELAGKYQYLVTDVDENNPRSVNAHIKSGFEIIATEKYAGSTWHIVLWDWNK